MKWQVKVVAPSSGNRTTVDIEADNQTDAAAQARGLGLTILGIAPAPEPPELMQSDTSTHTAASRAGRSCLKRMISQYLPLVFSAFALFIALYAYRESTKWHADVGSATPSDLIPTIYDRLTDRGYFEASAAYDAKHRDEILRTMEIADSHEKEDWAIVFIRYSIGSNIYRKAHWMRRIDEGWYWLPFLSKYSDQKPADEAWLLEMTSKAEKWEAESSKQEF